ncbi:hypothetical protein [Bacillus sp. JJ1764]|uniref:hypothetical protein n=1 Tax=Bacillus sp. JJ1764 TaxID=3122964 RepID=UPI002FFE244A
MKNKNNIYSHELPTVRGEELSFEEYLIQKHILKKGEGKLKPISVNQYMNRLESMRRLGIYNEENQIDSTLVRKIQEQYKDWKTYEKTIVHYLNYKAIKLNRVMK